MAEPSSGMSLADRMKRYEQAQSMHLTRRVPVIVRVDGRAFHTYTRNCVRPYDPSVMLAMAAATNAMSRSIDGCRLAYTQSDEASFLLTDFARLETESWFGYDLQKVVSLAASGMTARYRQAARFFGAPMGPRAPEFDARAFNIPKDEVANYFLWRARDWHRNSILMFAQSHISHHDMHGKKLSELHEMLHVLGYNWATGASDRERNGTFVLDGNEYLEVLPQFDKIDSLVGTAMTWED